MNKKPFLIYKSSAGSGKTYTLAKNYIRLAFKSPFYFKKILAVTFTNKAANEMKERILDMLQDISSLGDKDLIREFAEHYKVKSEEIIERAKNLEMKLMHNYSYFAVSTIDTFFYSIIQSFTRDMKFRGIYNIEMDEELVINEVVSKFFSDLKKDSILSKWLIQFSQKKLNQEKDFIVVQEIKNIAKNLFKEEYKSLTPNLKNANYSKDIKRLKDYIYKTQKEFKSKVVRKGKMLYDEITSNGFQIEDFFQGQKGVGGFIYKSSQGLISEPGKWVLDCSESINKWRKKSFNRKKELDQLIHNKLMKSLNDLINIYHNEFIYYNSASELNNYIYAFGILGDLHQKVIQYRDENEVILISDLNELLKEIIGNDDVSFIFEKTGNRFNNFLIDEFQDTSHFQWKNFKPLIEESISSGDENLIVGDVKQSIYRWRGSDPSIMQTHVKKDINSELISSYQLKSNWRSGEIIVDFNNNLFSNISSLFDERISKEISKIYNSELEQKIIELKKNQGFVEVMFNKPDDDFNEGGIKFAIGKIEQLQDLGYPASDIGIIVRDNNEAKLIAEALIDKSKSDSKYNYNHVSADALDIKSAPVVRFFISIFNYLINNKDRLALSEIVFFYFNIVKSKTDFSHLALSNKEKNSLLPKEFSKEKNIISRLPIYEMVEYLIRIFQLNQLQDQVPYIQSFQDLVLEFKKNNNGDLITFLKWWKENNKKKLHLSEQLNAIQLITIHKAKGLEFNNVILPFCNWKLDHDTQGKEKILWVNLNKLNSAFQFPFPLKYKSKHPKTVFIKEHEEERLKAYIDNINLLYVAFTRPKSGLFVHAETSKGKINNVSDILFLYLKNNIIEKENSQLYQKGSLNMNENKITNKSSYNLNSYLSVSWNERVRVKKSKSEIILKKENKKSIKRGEKLHSILSYIYDYNGIEDGLKKAINKNIISSEESKDYLSVIKKMFENEMIRSLFDPSKKSKNEIEVLDRNAEIFRLDRVVQTEKNKIIVIDYKTGSEKTQDKIQVENYISLLKSLNYKSVEGRIFYLDSNKMKEVYE